MRRRPSAVGYDKLDPAGRDGGNPRNGMRAKTVLTGPGRIEMPGPVIVRKRQRRLDGMSQIGLSLTARGLATGEIAARLEEVYGVRVSKDTVCRFTGKVIGEMAQWCNWPLDRAYPVPAQSRSRPSRKEF